MKTIYTLVVSLVSCISTFAQNVGIGTDNPEAKLHVAGNVITDSQQIVMGNVGINTLSPAYRLHVQETTNQQVLGLLEGNGGSRRIEVSNGAQRSFFGTVDGVSSFGSISQHDVAFCTGSFERWRLKHSSGFLGYNTESPTVPLDVNASYEQTAARFTGISYHTRLQISNGALLTELGVTNTSNIGYVGTFSNHSFSIQTNNSSRIFIQEGTGNVGIGMVNPLRKLDVAGDISGNNIFADVISIDEVQTASIHQDDVVQVSFYTNDFFNQGYPHENVTYYKDREHRVHLSGIVGINGTQTGAMFILPLEYRPSGNLVFCAMTSSGNSQRINVNAAGHVTIQGNLSGWVSMNGISFRAI